MQLKLTSVAFQTKLCQTAYYAAAGQTGSFFQFEIGRAEFSIGADLPETVVAPHLFGRGKPADVFPANLLPGDPVKNERRQPSPHAG